MYGSSNPVLRHFGADDIAMQATLQAVDERRQRGEYVSPSEEVIQRPTPEYDEYFEFNVPVASGLGEGTRDLLVEEALGIATPARRAGAAVGAQSGASPSTSNPVASTRLPHDSPSPGSYDSTPETAYQSRGYASGGSVTDSPEVSPFNYGRSNYGQRRSSRSSPDRSSENRGATPPRRSYGDGPSIQQPPFRAGTPVSGPVRRPGMTGTPGSSSRSRTASPGGARSSRSAATSPIQPEASGPVDAESQQQPTQNASGAAGSSGEGPVRVRGIGAKITGRPATARPARQAPGAATTARTRPVSASPASPPGAGARASTAAAGRTGRSPYQAPAWAPAPGIENMRLGEMDEAARVALMLNDPEASRGDVGERTEPHTEPSAVSGTSQDEPQRRQAHHGPGVPPPQGESTFRASPEHQDFATSPGYGQQTRSSLVSEQYFTQYRLRKHREVQGVPDYRFSQPRSHGAHAPVPQHYFSFDEAHPAIAEQHYARSPAQESLLQAERRKMQKEKMRAARAASHSRVTSPGPTTRQLAADVERLMRVREAGRARLRQLEEQGESLRQETWQIQQRALDAIAKSEQITAVTALRSRSPSASPPRRRSRTPSPSAYYRGAGGYGGGNFITAAYSRSPSPSPARSRPYGASRAATEDAGYQYAYADEGSAYAVAAYRQEGSEAYHSGSEAQESVGRQPSNPPPFPVSPAPAPSEAQEILELINGMGRLPQQVRDAPSAESSGPQRSTHREVEPAEDHLARASSAATKRGPMGLLDEAEQRIAMGAYDRSRYEEYQRQVDLEMQRRAMDGGYDSDVDRDEAAGTLVRDPEQEAAEAEEARRRAEEESWRFQDEWMDEYRRRLGPEDGYLPSRAHSVGSSGEGGGGAYYGAGLHSQRSALSEADEELLGQPYVPMVSPELPTSASGYASEGPGGYHPHRRTQRGLFHRTTVPQPFQFEEREKARPKPIAKVKLEQDLALRRAEEEAARKRHFRASPVPPAVLEPRYEHMLLEKEVKRQLSHQQRLEELSSLVEKPFSFYYRDQERQAQREELARAAKDPNRFQTGFRARDAPAHTKGERLKAMMLQMEAKREATRRRVEEARRAARERAEEEAQRRREAANRAYQERLRSVDPAVHNGPHPSRPTGVLPDFNALHRHHEIQMARARANIRKRVTVPQEFKLNGASPDEQTARTRKAQERRQRIILDMQVDAELLPEMRWPYKSPRGKVRRTPPPAYLVEWMARSPGNHAANVRKSSTVVATQEGAFMTRDEREAVARKASEKLRAEALKRADRLLKASLARKQQEAAAAAGGGGDQDFGLLSDVGATAAGGADQSSSARGGAMRRRAAVAGRQDNPEVYVEARHMQIEQRVRVVVEDALLDQGIEAYRYVEGVGGGKKKSKSGQADD